MAAKGNGTQRTLGKLLHGQEVQGRMVSKLFDKMDEMNKNMVKVAETSRKALAQSETNAKTFSDFKEKDYRTLKNDVETIKTSKAKTGGIITGLTIAGGVVGAALKAAWDAVSKGGGS